MNITIYGIGYVGLVTGVCFAELGHKVCCVDIDVNKINNLKRGILPIYEQNLENLLEKNSSNITFTTELREGIEFSEVQMIAVGTPQSENGSANLEYVYSVANYIASHMSNYKLIINKSTVPVGTGKEIGSIISNILKERKINIEYSVASNPEFLREGSAINDFMQPDRIIIGCKDNRSEKLLKELYQPLIKQNYSLISMDIESAELSKYAANSFLATKISFINEMAAIADATGADIKNIQKALGTDSRISPYFLNPGCGFGGSCFPKDVQALKYVAESKNIKANILNATLETNSHQQNLLFTKIKQYFKDSLQNKTIAIWGLSFKPGTNDIRYATSNKLIDSLIEEGASIKAYDPMAMPEIKEKYKNNTNLHLCDNAISAINDADILVLVTEWNEFQEIPLETIKYNLKEPLIFDCRNFFDINELKSLEFKYYSIGRGNNLNNNLEVINDDLNNVDRLLKGAI